MYKAVLFDLDGTLLPSLDYWLKSFHVAFTKFGQKHSDEVVIARCFYRDREDIASEFGVDYEALNKHLSAALWDEFQSPSLFPQVRESLQSFWQNGIKMALVTSSTRDIVDLVLAKLDMQKYFSTTVAALEAPRFKPHPAPLHLALDKLGYEPKEAIMVGDGRADMLAGKAAGTACALFLAAENAPYHKKDELVATSPDFIFEDFRQLHDYLGKKCGFRSFPIAAAPHQL